MTSGSITETFSGAIFLIGGSADDTDVQHAVCGIGFCAPDAGAATEEHCMMICAEDGIGTAPDTGTTHSNTDCIRVPNPTSVAAASLVQAQYSASISGGVRLNFSVTTVQVRITAILFAGLSRAYTDGCTSGIAGASEDVGGTTNFTPDAVIFAASDTDLNTADNDAIPNIGFAINDGGPSQVCAYLNADDATDPADADGIILTDAAYVHAPAGSRTSGNLNLEQSTVTAFDADGFDHIADAGTPDAHYLALKFSGALAVACTNATVSASTGEQTFNVGFQPTVVIGMGTLLTTFDSQVNTANICSSSCYFVVSDDADRGYTWHHRANGVLISAGNLTEANTRSEDAFVLYNHEGTVVQRATWAGPSGSGFKLNFSVASAAGTLTLLAIGPAAQTSVHNETVSISEGFLAISALTRVFDETVQVSETCVSITNAMLTSRFPAGWTFSGGSERGRALVSGSEMGAVL